MFVQPNVLNQNCSAFIIIGGWGGGGGLFSFLQVDGPIPGEVGGGGGGEGGYVILGLQPRDKEAMVAKETI